MEDIKVGEYVRTVDGYIGQVTQVNEKGSYDSYCWGACLVDVKYKNSIGISAKKIKSHSPNIIDLIEVGDFVNGYKVLYNCNETEKEQCNGEYRKCIIVATGKTGEWKMVDWDIGSIVTREQFESMKYVVGDNK